MVTVCIKHKVTCAFKNLVEGKKDKITNGKLTKETKQTKETGEAVGAVEKTGGEKEDKKDEEMECEDGEKDEEDEGSTIFSERSRIMCTCGVARTVHGDAFNLAHVAVQVYSMFVTLDYICVTWGWDNCVPGGFVVLVLHSVTFQLCMC